MSTPITTPLGFEIPRFVDGELEWAVHNRNMERADRLLGSAVGRRMVLESAMPGATTGWMPIAGGGERFAIQLTSGSAATQLILDGSVDGQTTSAQIGTASHASSTQALITPPIRVNDANIQFLRWTVISGGPVNVARGI